MQSIQNIFLTLLLSVFSTFTLSAQNTIFVNINQPPALEVDAGENITICLGDTVEIGGNPTAILGSGTYNYFWSPDIRINNRNIANPLVSPANTTVYTVVVTDENDCAISKNITVEVDLCTSTKLSEEAENIKLYPNPAKNNLNVAFSSINLENALIEISDIAGRIVFEERINNKSLQEINLSQFSDGLYFFILRSDDFYHRQKFIIKK